MVKGGGGRQAKRSRRPARSSSRRHAFVGGHCDIGGRDPLAAFGAGQHERAAEQPAQRVQAAGAVRGGGEYLELGLVRPAPERVAQYCSAARVLPRPLGPMMVTMSPSAWACARALMICSAAPVSV